MQQALSHRISIFNSHTVIPNRPFHRSFSSSSFHKPRFLLSPTPSFPACLSPPMRPDSRNVALRNRLSPNPPMDDSSLSSDALHHQDLRYGGGGFKEWYHTASFRKWRFSDLGWALKNHPIPCLFACSLVFFMGVEYTLRMVPPTSPPYDLGFVVTRPLNRFLSSRPSLNTLLAALNTVFVAMVVVYLFWALLVEGRARLGIAATFMFTCRGILGYSTQLPVPEEYLGSGADFPVGNASFFLFYSGHVASALIASIDMRRMQRKELAWTYDFLNVLQVVRLLATRGHYTIDLAVGVGAAILFDFLAGKYEEYKAGSSGSYAPLEEREKPADGNV